LTCGVIAEVDSFGGHRTECSQIKSWSPYSALPLL
jgi:hypothetical protein